MRADYSDIGQRVREIRKAARLSQAELAQRAGFTQVYLSQVESGSLDNWTRGFLVSVADALSVPVWRLLGHDRAPGLSAPPDIERIVTRLAVATPEQRRQVEQMLDVLGVGVPHPDDSR